MCKKNLLVIFNLFLSFLIASTVYATSIQLTLGTSNIHLEWDPPISLATVTGYRIFHRTEEGSYNFKIPTVDVDVNTNECAVLNLDKTVAYYFVARSYNDYYESANSNEIMIAPSDTTSTTTPITTTTTISTGITLSRPTGLRVISR